MLVDLTLPLHTGTPSFPGYDEFDSDRHVSESTGAVSHTFRMNTHLGTHVDAPAHFVEGGATIDEVPPDRWFGPARIVDLRDHRGETITANELEAAAPDVAPGDRIVLVAGDVDETFGEDSFFTEATVLAESAADLLVTWDVSLVANDFLTEAIDGPDRPVHNRLLEAGVPIVEYLANTRALVEADADSVELTALPLLLSGLEAAPARVVAHLVESD